MGKKNKNPLSVAKFLKPTLGMRQVGEYLPATADQVRRGVDSRGHPTCPDHLAGALWFACTCGHIYGQMTMEVRRKVRCGCKRFVKRGNDQDSCMVVRQHSYADAPCIAQNWHEQFGSVELWLSNYEAAVKVMWAVRHSAMSMVSVQGVFGFGSTSPYVQTVGVLLQFMGASHLVVVPNTVCGELIATVVSGNDWKPGTTDRCRFVLQRAFTSRHTGYTKIMQLFQAFAAAVKLYPQSTVGFQWVLSNLDTTPDELFNVFRINVGVTDSVLQEVKSRLGQDDVELGDLSPGVGDVKFSVTKEGRVAMARTSQLTLLSGAVVVLMRRVPLPGYMGDQHDNFRKKSPVYKPPVQVINYFGDPDGVTTVFRRFNYLNLAGEDCVSSKEPLI